MPPPPSILYPTPVYVLVLSKKYKKVTKLQLRSKIKAFMKNKTP